MTTVINLYAGACAGKTTLAAGLFYEMKKRGCSVENIQEFIKTWAYLKIKPSKFDEFYITGNQINNEAQLYNKVDYIITDSPILLCTFYEEYIFNQRVVEPSVDNFLKLTSENGIKHINFFIQRDVNMKYNPEGRYQTEEEAIGVDNLLYNFLINKGVKIQNINSNNEGIKSILNKLGE